MQDKAHLFQAAGLSLREDYLDPKKITCSALGMAPLLMPRLVCAVHVQGHNLLVSVYPLLTCRQFYIRHVEPYK